MDDDVQTLIASPNGIADDHEYGVDDQVIIYSAFPSSNQALIDIPALYDITAVELDRTMTLKK
ncbi:hypothetical protein M404DRAFT_26511 [Pisolithus tinctorius Marx 270]|uniref:Uncharacterized protein n=1 Tax=Pisolithus tinctorius Marx 270 TaxID=870435 RepID=A0A0C3P985_PISTI|nr:hypothetical protein M404DRAFT_26511 [Pisolithus tinctorius Marx 270]